jgi:uncharacterized protein (TIGR03437 family)
MIVGVLAFLLTTHIGLGQQPIPNVAGIWQFTVGKFSATIQINQTGTGLVGQFTSVGNLTPAFTSTIDPSLYPVADLILKWNTSRTDIPGINVPGINGLGVIYIYWGSIVAGGTAMQGGYGPSPSQSVGTWSATRLAGLGPAIAGVRNAASGSTGAIAPGEIISIFANPDTNPIGPKSGAGLQLDQSGKVATSLGGVRVHFLQIDTYAPLTFVSAGQINAVVPYEVAGLTTVGVQVEYLGQASERLEFQVGPTAPAIFTANGSGVGPGAILNDDGITINGPNKPEPRGGYVVLFVTGEGQITPPGISGKVTQVAATTPLTPAPLGSVEVRINGQSATVLFVGEAPDLVSGVLQLNVQIPVTISPGNVPIQVVIGGNASQNGVTVAVQ